MAIITTNTAKRSCRPRQADRNKNPIALCCLVLMMIQHTPQMHYCSAFSPLFTASSSPAKSITSIGSAARQLKFNGAVATILSVSAKNKGTKSVTKSTTKSTKSKKEKGENKEEDHRRWLSWMSSGTLASKTRHADEVRMREAEELGGVPRTDRYSANDWWHNTLSLPNSAILMSIRGPVLFMGGWACFLSILYRYLLTASPQAASLMCVSSTPHSLMSSALSLLLVFKTNSAYQRFSEGRKIWENIINLSRDMYRMINLYENEMGRSKRRRLQRLIAAFPYLLRHRIRPNLIMHRVDDVDNVRDPENSIVLYQDKAAHDLDPELAAVANQEEREGKSRRKRRPLYWVDRRTLPWRLLPPDALEPCARSQNRPLWVCDRMAQELRSIPDGPCFTSRERLTMIGKVEKLSNSIGSCERIHQTAVPLNYARHSLRALSIWLFTLPLCLVKDLELLTAPAVCLVSWLMFGVYEIGYSIEDPFQGTLRLSVLCDTIRRDVLADEVIRNTAFERESKNSSDEDREYESPIVKESSRQVLKVDEIQKKLKDKKSKSNNENGSGTVVEELPVLPSKRVIWEGSSSSAFKKP